ncbi:MAG: LysR substrate-binding domain-containing protein [Pseudomonadota bacterium]|nr:LysR substrate-binding domain-containing protein [Pseudomonadota bacterium]
MFQREGNLMQPTAAARQVLPAIRQSLALIASVFPPPAIAGRQTLRIGVLPSFAANWLVPRLDDFHAAHPLIAIALDARLEISPIAPGQLDAAIRYGDGHWPGLESERLIADTLFPACSPEYRERMAIAGVEDFARCRLLRNSWHQWTPWFQMAGLVLPEPTDSAPYDDAGLMLDAAAAGHGIGLVRNVIARDALIAGRLVRLSATEMPFAGAYYFVVPAALTSKHPASLTFGSWLANRLRHDFEPTSI